MQGVDDDEETAADDKMLPMAETEGFEPSMQLFGRMLP
jgi:hypothetical protein